MTAGQVHIIGAGLIGTSIGIGLVAEGWNVSVEDADPTVTALAHGLGAGSPLGDAVPDLVIVATPPALAPGLVVDSLRYWPSATVTDVASVKAVIADEVHAAGDGLSARYVGSHPMAGREISGAQGAQGDLFRARPWVLCPNGAGKDSIALVRAVAEALGADVVTLEAAVHDAAVARVSHAPQVVSSAVAAALGGLSQADVALAGQGLRDVTRIAASLPGMWSDIARLNRDELVATLSNVIDDLVAVRDAADIGAAVNDLIERGRTEVARIPGKHGGTKRDYGVVTVLVPDEPGHLLRLLGDVSALGVNIEDVSIEHSPRQPVGLTTVFVLPHLAGELKNALQERGWEIAS